jgi:hypothetical protein
VRGGELPPLVGASFSRSFPHRILVSLEARAALGDIRSQLDLSLAGGMAWRPLRSLVLVGGFAVGYVALHADRGLDGSMWTSALLLRPHVRLDWLAWRGLGLRLDLVTGSFYRGDMWIVAWEPTCGVVAWF